MTDSNTTVISSCQSLGSRAFGVDVDPPPSPICSSMNRTLCTSSIHPPPPKGYDVTRRRRSQFIRIATPNRS